MDAPSAFHPAGRVVAARVSATPPPFIRTRRYRGRRADGVRYERLVQAHLLGEYPQTYVAGPWLHFRSESSDKWRWCQPDGLLIDVERGIITCVEVKYSHTANAWWQTRELYLPVLAHLFPIPLWRLQVCEVVKWYDPSVVFPEQVELAAEVGRPSEKFKVHICRP